MSFPGFQHGTSQINSQFFLERRPFRLRPEPGRGEAKVGNSLGFEGGLLQVEVLRSRRLSHRFG